MENKKYQLTFFGKGEELFSIWIVNFFLQIITLGFYYPWAKAKSMQYLWGASEFEGSRLQFHGTGKEMFIGFIKAIALISIIYLAYFLLLSQEMAFLGSLILIIGIFAFLPLAIHGSYRYRMSRTSWRGIRFGYRGELRELIKIVYKGGFLTIITFGIYGAWFSMNIRNYVISNIRFGNAKFNYNGRGLDYLLMNLGGYFLSIITLGIYFFWWQKHLFNYYINNLSIESETGEKITFVSKASAGKIFKVGVINILLVFFTLGLGTPWAIVNTMNFVFSNIELEGNIDVEKIVQTEENNKDATGEDMADFFDLDLAI